MDGAAPEGGQLRRPFLSGAEGVAPYRTAAYQIISMVTKNPVT